MAEKVRYTIDTTVDARSALMALAKKHKLTQGGVIEVLMADVDMGQYGYLFDLARKKKVEARATRKDLVDMLDRLPKEEIEALLKQRVGG